MLFVANVTESQAAADENAVSLSAPPTHARAAYDTKALWAPAVPILGGLCVLIVKLATRTSWGPLSHEEKIERSPLFK